MLFHVVTKHTRCLLNFGTIFEGNETNKLLKHINELREILPDKYHIFVDTLNYVKESCFGFSLGQNYKENIRKFLKNWLILFKNLMLILPTNAM